MDNKEIQEKRMRGYFIEATREMLKGEGLKSINVRAVADRAGYSYATLYNYFKDIKELIFICVQGFQEEAETFINSKTKKSKPGIERISERTKAYIEYFTQYPGIFELFFLEKLNTLSGKQPTANLIFTFYDRITAEDWEYCVRENIFTRDEVASRTKILKYSITGILLMYMNRMHPESYKDFLADVDQLLETGLRTK
ncbi:MAG: TetR/AcrR family transcriptional regulator [Bacteroidales bacterium]|nr:TetR/AcrR family transcriptional regulator [Bacteroidales bacterium]